MRKRDEGIENRVFQFLSRGREIGFEKAIVAGKSASTEGQQGMSFYMPASAAKSLNVIDRAKLVNEGGAPAYEIMGTVQLTVPSDEDPRIPMRASVAANEMKEDIRNLFWEDFPWTHNHLRKASEHLGFWTKEGGDNEHTGMEHLTRTTCYYKAGRDAILKFAKQNPDEFVEVVGSKETQIKWQQLQAEADQEQEQELQD